MDDEMRKIRGLKNKYVPGTEIMLIKMEDTQAPPFGTKGIVDFVDDIGNIHVRWSNGSSLSVIDGVDSFKVIRYGDEDDNGD